MIISESGLWFRVMRIMVVFISEIVVIRKFSIYFGVVFINSCVVDFMLISVLFFLF